VEPLDHQPFNEYSTEAGKEMGYDDIDLNGPQRTGD